MTLGIKEIGRYCAAHSDDPPSYLEELERETHMRTLAPQMLSGKIQGRLLSTISQLAKPKCILEIGTFTGYSALCLAEGLDSQGTLHTIEVNDELAYLTKKYFKKSPYDHLLHLHMGKAEEVIPRLQISPDLVYLDGGKKHYTEHYELIIEKMKPGGLILVDNVLWFGKIKTPELDKDAMIIHNFNQDRLKDKRVSQLILPIRDGLSILKKKEET